MISPDLAGIGPRIARYRRMNGLTAEGLAALAGPGVYRSLIAKLESGHRADLQVGQLLAIAWALRVTPTALLLPLEDPDAEVEADGERSRSVGELLQWLDGRRLPDPAETTPAQKSVAALLNAIDAVRIAEQRLRVIEATIATALQREFENAEMRELEQSRRKTEEEVDRQRTILEALRPQPPRTGFQGF